MSSALFIPDNSNDLKWLEQFAKELNGWTVQAADSKKLLLQGDLQDKQFHFYIFSKSLNNRTMQEIAELHHRHPHSIIIYYYSYIKHRQFIDLHEAGVQCCIVGENQQKTLIEALEKLWLHHWRRIPESFLPQKGQNLSARGRKILGYIERQDLTQCNIASLARYLEISGSHCRMEFKGNFGTSFREFKKKLFRHYESVLLFEYRLKPNEIYEILNYHHLSGYSRAFKARHGKTWRTTRYVHSQ